MILSVRINSPMYERIASGKDVIAERLTTASIRHRVVFDGLSDHGHGRRIRPRSSRRKVQTTGDRIIMLNMMNGRETLEEGDLREKLIVESYQAGTLVLQRGG